MRDIRFSIVIVTLVTAACGSVVSVEDGGAVEPDGYAQSEGCTESPLDALPDVPCEAGWRVPGLLRLPTGETSYQLDSAVGTSSNTILLGYMAAGADPGKITSRVRAYDETLCPLGTMTLVEADDHTSLRPVDLAVTANGAGALYGAWLQRGKVAILEDDARMRATPLTVPVGHSHTLDAGRGGSLTLLSEGILFAVSSAGISALGPLAIFGLDVGRTAFEDGSFLAVWAADEYESNDGPVHVVAQRFAANGTPLGARQVVVEQSNYGFISPGPRIVSTRAGDGVAVGFASRYATQIFMLDQDGTVTRPPIAIPGGGFVDEIALAEIDPGVLLLALGSTSDDQVSRLRLAIIDSVSGEVRAEWDLGANFIHGSSPRIALTAAGAMLFAGGYDMSAEQHVMTATPVTRCSW